MKRVTMIFMLIFLFHQVVVLGNEKINTSNSNLLGDSVITEQVTYKQNFEEGHTNGWESYPPFQDTGFDPNFYAQRISDSESNKSKYTLMFEYHPTFTTEHEMGFIKKFLLVAADNSKISFIYKADGYGDFKNMKVVLYGTDGNQYSFITSIDDNGKWNSVNFPIENFKNSGKSLKPGTGINGFSIETYIPKTNPDVTYRLFLDDLNITALQPVKFKLTEPDSKYLENLNITIPLHHYSAGENFNLSVEIPKEIKLKNVNVNLTDPKGKIILKNTSLDYSNSKNSWTKNNLYTFSDDDPIGQWNVKLEGEDNSGKKIETEFKIWLTKKNQSHPRIYFSGLSKGIENLKQKINDEHWKGWWDTLTTEAANLRKTSNLGSINFGAETSSITKIPPTKMSLESLKQVDLSVYDTVYLLPTLRHYFNIMTPAQKILQENALIYAVTGDTAAGKYAKEALLIISGWDTWTHPWFKARHRETYYPVGELGVRAAFCYDIVYPLMTKGERKKVTEGLLKNCIIPVYKEYVLEDRVPSATSNWVGNTVSGGITCALAIYGDNPDLGNLEPYISGMIKKLEVHINNTLDTTGAWGEGIGYQGFAYSNVLPALSVIKNVMGLDLSSKALFDSYKYFLYNYSEPKILDLGDSHPGLTTLSNFAWLSSHSNDPVFQWLYMQSPRKNIFDFMFGNKGKEIPPTSLPTSKEFSEIGAAVFRSGWNLDDIVLNFRSGPFYNHQHFDQGSIQLNAFGESLITEAGWANYYNDPRYESYYTQPIGHSTIILDGDGGSQSSGDYLHFIKAANKHAQLKDFINTDFYSAVTGELSNVYYDKLKLFERNIIFVNKKYFVIFDKLKSSKDPHEYDLLFHFEDFKDVNLKDNNVFTFKMEKAVLFSQVLFPENIKMKVVEGPSDLGIPIRHPGYVQINNTNKSMEENFLTILYPEKGNGYLSNLSNPRQITKLKGDNFIGINVEENNQTDKLFFSTNEKEIKSDKILTDGKIAEVTLIGNKLSNFVVHDATNFNYNGKKLIEANAKVTAAAKLNNEADEWEIIRHRRTDKNSKVNILLSSKPGNVTLNEKELNNNQYKIEGKTLIISLTVGKNSIEIKY